MEGLTQLIPSLVEQGDDEMWSDYLSSCSEMKVFVTKSNETVPVINSLLNQSETRCYGLKLLDIFLKQCPKSCINEHVVQWIHLCLKGVQNSQASFPVICSLIEASLEFPDSKRQVAQVLIAKILDAVIDYLKSTQQNFIEALKCLYTCLYHYGKSAGNHKDTIEKCLINMLMSDELTINYCAKCYHLLAQCGPHGAESINYKQNWQTQQLIVINSLHSILDQFYSEVNEILGSYCPIVIETRKLDLPTVNDEYPLIKSHKLSRLYCSLIEILDRMLLDYYPTSKRIYPEMILGVICRTLAVTYKFLLANVSNSSYSVMTHLCRVHVNAIKLFNSLLLCLRTNLLPFSSLISKLFIQIFKSTDVDAWVQGREKPFSRVRCCGYKCLLTWLSVAKSCSLEQIQTNVIVEAIIKDIRCEKKVVSLNIDKKSGKGRGNKKLNVAESNYKMEMSEDTCESALACLPFILKCPVSYVIVKELQEIVVRLIFEIQRSLRCDNNLPAPYHSARCRVRLYSALKALCVTIHPQFPPPLHYANFLFTSSACDPDINVQRECTSALNSLFHILRPAAPSFDLQADLDSEIIPINPYPEPNEKELKHISLCELRKGYETVSLCKKALPVIMGFQAGKDTSLSSSKSGLVISSVCSLDVNNSVMEKTNSNMIIPDSIDSIHDAYHGNDLIDLADSSDESLILVDSQKNQLCETVTASNVESNLLENNSLSNNSYLVDNKDEDCSMESSETTLHKTKSSNKFSESESSVVCDESNKNLHVTKNESGSHAITIVNSFTQNDTSNIIEVEVDEETSAVNNKEPAISPRRSRRITHNKDCEIIINDKPKYSEDVIIIQPDDKLPKTPLRHSSCNIISETDNVKSTENSEVVTVVDSPNSSPSRRSTRNVKSSPSTSPVVKEKLPLQDEIMIIVDKEVPPAKKSRLNKDKLSDDVEVCVTDDDDEMMNSFIDVVPVVD